MTVRHPVRFTPSLVIGLLALLVECGLARAEITPEAQDAVERHLAAVGGRARVESSRTAHLSMGISAFGLTGRTQAWLQAPDRRATEVAIGPFTLRDGCDGARAWRTDPTGNVVPLDGRDLEEARGTAWFENDGWLAADQRGGRVTVAGAETDSAGSYTVLEVTPPAGRPRRVYLNRSTWLVDRIVARNDQMTVTLTLSDYREVAGRRLAFRSRQQIAGMPANDATLTVDSIRFDVAIPASRFAPPGAGASEVRWLGREGIARLPFTYSARHVWLRASVNGAPPADFLYDTGASLTVIDSAYAAAIGLATAGRLQGHGAGATGSGSFARIDTLRVEGPDGDGVEMRDLKVAVLDLDSVLAPFFWRNVAGVVGFDFIARFVNEIDFDASTLVLHDPGAFRYGGTGATIPITLAGHAPAVSLTLDGRYEGLCRIDVGSGGTVDFHGPFARKHGLDRTLPAGVEVTGGGFGGTFRSRLTRATSLALGPYRWEHPLVSLSSATVGAFASEEYAGNIGNQILERFRCTIDYERRVLHLDPGKHYARPDVFSRSGVRLAKSAGVVHAAQVIPGSPAEKAGLRAGDEVVRIDGRPALEHTIDEVEALLERGAPGSRVKLEIARAGKAKQVTIRLKEVL